MKNLLECPNCGAQIDGSATFCTSCKTRLDSENPSLLYPYRRKEYYDMLERRLGAVGFTITKGISMGSYMLDLVAVRSSFEKEKLGRWDRFIVVTGLETRDIATVQNFSDAVAEHVLNPEKSGNYPRTYVMGVRNAQLIVPTFVSEQFPEDVKKWISKKPSKKHFAAFEFPVLVSLENRQICYCSKTPIWGAAYYHGFRKFVEGMLGF